MLIIDRKSDVYDHVIKITGVDKTIVYKREKLRNSFREEFSALDGNTSTVSRNLLCNYFSVNFRGGTNATYKFFDGVIYLAGEIQPFVVMIKSDPRNVVHGYSVEKFFYSLEDMNKEELSSFENQPVSYMLRDSLKDVFKPSRIKRIKPLLDDLASKFKNPVFYISSSDLLFEGEYNKQLLSNFSSLNVNYNQLYQNIHSLLGSWNSQEDIPVVDDKHLAKAKGFDCRSFKKDPTKRKPKKCI